MERVYKEDSTKHIDAREFTRKRPGTYCGSTEYSTQLMKELFANALDEHNIGHGNNIYITIDTKTNTYTCRDEGQGFIPNAPRPNGETMLSECFSVINTSGKYDDTDDSIYGGSALGLNGIGMKLVCYLSKTSTISSSDGSGVKETLVYKDGLFESRSIDKCDISFRGTIVDYQPDPQFFQHPEANLTELRCLFNEISALCPKLTIVLQVDDKKETFHKENGIQDLVDAKVRDKEIIPKRFSVRNESGNDLIDICLTYTSNYSEDITSYVNYGLTESGVHLTALRTNLTRVINKYANENGLLKKGVDNLTGQELSEGLVIVFNIKAKKVAYDSQSKVRVVDIDKTLINEVINKDFVSWMEKNPKSVKTIVDKALEARKAKAAAKKAREAVRGKKEKGGLKAKLAVSKKFVDCVNKNPSERNLLLVEGNSAGSSAIEARNAKTDAIYMLRGKVLSARKTTVDKLLANQEISDIISIIGGGFGNNNFDVNKMNFDKIVVTADQDADGEAIELLLVTFFFTYMRPLIEAGKLYRAVTPLYIVTLKNDEKKYFYTEKEYRDWNETNVDKNAKVLRAKGLGELNAAQLHDICFKDQRFKRITISDAEETDKLLEILEGSAVNPRKDYIYNNAKRLGFNFD